MNQVNPNEVKAIMERDGLRYLPAREKLVKSLKIETPKVVRPRLSKAAIQALQCDHCNGWGFHTSLLGSLNCKQCRGTGKKETKQP